MPMVSLAPGGGGYRPAACSRSARFDARGSNFHKDLTGPAVTSGTCCQVRLSGPSATMAATPPRYNLNSRCRGAALTYDLSPCRG